jgi:hypothetical protein
VGRGWEGFDLVTVEPGLDGLKHPPGHLLPPRKGPGKQRPLCALQHLGCKTAALAGGACCTVRLAISLTSLKPGENMHTAALSGIHTLSVWHHLYHNADADAGTGA